MLLVKDNVISLEKVREEKAYRFDLEDMSFGEIIDESSDIIKKLKLNGLEDDLTFKSKSLLNELAQRAEKQNYGMTNSIKKMRKTIETKLKELAQ